MYTLKVDQRIENGIRLAIKQVRLNEKGDYSKFATLLNLEVAASPTIGAQTAKER